MKPGVASRRRAADILERIVTHGAYSNVVLDTLGDLPEREHRQVQRLVLDTLRWMPRLDAAIDAVSVRSVADLDPPVAATLRIAAAELLAGGDAHGVVDSAVESVRTAGHDRAAGFVNAVARKLATAGFPDPGPSPEGRALATGTPPWLRTLLAADLGEDHADAFLAAALQPAPIGVRVRPGGDAGGGGLEPVEGIPAARWAADRSAVGPGLAVMDPASTAVVQALAIRPGDTVLDVAAAPGNKTLAIADALGSSGRVIAADAHPRRAERLRRRLRRSGAAVDVVLADGTRPPFRQGVFDRILLDAPCSGLGTLRRRPEIKLRLEPGAPERMAQVQRRLIEASLPLLAPGGLLVYSVCTLPSAETVDVVAGLGARPPQGVPGVVHGDGVLLGPHLTGTDGMFVAVLES